MGKPPLKMFILIKLIKTKRTFFVTQRVHGVYYSMFIVILKEKIKKLLPVLKKVDKMPEGR